MSSHNTSWRTKYQMSGLKDGEWYNLRDNKIYIKKDGKFTLKEEECTTTH